MFIKWILSLYFVLCASTLALANPSDVLFVGSSSIAYWNLKHYFPDFRTVNIGTSGSVYADVRDQIDTEIVPNGATRIVMYSGDNDIYLGQAPEQVLSTFQLISENIHQKLPSTHIFVISIKPSPARRFMIPNVKKANALIKEYSESTNFITYVEVFSHMINEAGEPHSNLFVRDGVHLSPKGYELWSSILMPFLKAN